MPASLIDSQFDTLERPDAETGVFVADATLPISTIAENAVSWWMTSGSDNEKDGEGR